MNLTFFIKTNVFYVHFCCGGDRNIMSFAMMLE